MKRLFLILLQVVVSAEVTLQILGLVLPSLTSRAGDLVTTDHAITILCVGDSHTYGAPLPAEESYPAQLQARLDETFEGLFRVVNLGVPGMNSAMMASRFEANLASYRPDLVILWAGANNIWNENETEHWDEEAVSDWPYRLLLRLKLVRLVRFLGSGVAQSGTGRQAELLGSKSGSWATWRLGDEVLHMENRGVLSEQRVRRGVRRDLPRMVELARAYGVPILLVTYPYEEFAWVNEPILEVARELEVDWLDTLSDRSRAAADGYSESQLIVMAAGSHPRGPLYSYIVDSMLPIALALRETP